MVKPEWGVKRTCHSCGAKFYDLKRDPIVCPKCGTTFDFETALKSRKVRTVADAKPVPAKAKAKVRPVKDEDTDALEDIEDIEDVEDVDDDDVLAEEEDADDTLDDVVVTGPKRVASDDEDEDEDIDLDLDDDDEDEALLVDEDEDDSLDESDEESDDDEDEESRDR
ncbi:MULTISPECIES: TIGR02300 family protein [Oceanibaculum]|uniref:TIGR02300 family protein n=1 Tax=Oceanibaculum TaxID=659693 RepID=UPI000EB51EB2|nr:MULTISPECIES: TIGR02300 family protein [Oceanibaculum]MCH2395574.1 TIGR02300 family protein [Oceanibaculum sp.]